MKKSLVENLIFCAVMKLINFPIFSWGNLFWLFIFMISNVIILGNVIMMGNVITRNVNVISLKKALKNV